MTRPADISQWRDRTEEPAIIWTYTGVWELLPVAVDTVGPEADEYDQITRAWFAARAYMTFDEVCKEHADLTPDQIEELYQQGDGSETRAGLPESFVATGVNSDGSDEIIYVDDATIYQTRRATLAEAAPYMYADDVEEIRQLIAETRAEYDVC